MLCGSVPGTAATGSVLTTAEVSVRLSVAGGSSTGAVEMHRIFKQLSWPWCSVGGQHGCAAGSGAATIPAQANDVKRNTNTNRSAGTALAPCALVFAPSGILLTTLARE